MVRRYKLKSEILFLAVSYMDRILADTEVPSDDLQLVAAGAMLVASKFEGAPVGLSLGLVASAAGAFAYADLLQMEVAVLQALVHF